MSPTEIAEMIMARQWVTWLMIAGLLVVGLTMAVGIYRAYTPRKRKFRERF